MITDQVSTAEQPTGTSAEAATAYPPSQLPPDVSKNAKLPEQSGAQPRPTDRVANWLLGVEPQDVRFPVNICQVAFTTNYFAALTSDKQKVYVNKRLHGWHGNCKRRFIEFPGSQQQRPSSIVSFDHRDTLCLVFRTRMEFHSLVNLARVGAYETATAEVVAVGSRAGRSPLGALWCCRSALCSAEPAEAAFTVWTNRTEAPQRALLLGPSAVGRPERFLCFHWTSSDTVLLVSRQEPPPAEAQGHRRHHLEGQDRHQLLQQQPLVFCAYDTTDRRSVQRLCRRSVCTTGQFCLSPDGRLLLLSGGSHHQLLEAATLRQLLTLPRRPAAAFDEGAVALTNSGDLLVMLKSVLEIHRLGGVLAKPARYDLADLLLDSAGRSGGGGCLGNCRIFPVGELGALLVCEQPDGATGGGASGVGAGDKPGRLRLLRPQGRSLVALIDLNGNVIMRAEWPRARIHLVSDDLLVSLRRLTAKPFSAAHACIFDFNCPVSKRHCWAESTTATLATATTSTPVHPAAISHASRKP